MADIQISGIPSKAIATTSLVEIETAGGESSSNTLNQIYLDVLDALTRTTARNGTWFYEVDSGVADAYIVSHAPVNYGIFQDGIFTFFKALNANTGASTIQIVPQAVKSLKRTDGTDLQADDILAGGLYLVVYDGVNYQLLNPSVFGGGGGGLAEVPVELASSTDDPTSGHAALQGVVVVNGTIAITDQNTLSLVWWIDYGAGYVLANATGTLAGLKTDLEANLLLASDKANVRYVATEQAAYLGDMVNGFYITMTS